MCEEEKVTDAENTVKSAGEDFSAMLARWEAEKTLSDGIGQIHAHADAAQKKEVLSPISCTFNLV